ncbi:MAG: family 16 glycosylhydrolase [Hyphomonadaceae bacterium]|nr:family 16 glycosylhydrolase [Hyphomonadaceae bacterium]
MPALNLRAAAVSALLLGACEAQTQSIGDELDAETPAPDVPAAEPTAPVPAAPAKTYDVEDSFLKLFSEGHDHDWYKADFAYLNNVQRAGWEADNILFNDQGVELMLTRERKEMCPFTGAEYQRRGRYHYGRYEVVMRAAPGSGIVSSMFTHTGPSQGGDPHDEIDIEFLGHRTGELHINYFTAGKGHGSVYVDLPYDAAEIYQLYAFEWEPDEIRWYVGDQLVHTARAEDHPIPQTPGRWIQNIWTGSEDQYMWHGRPTFQSGATVGYRCASYQTAGDDSEQCSDHYSFDLPPVDLEDQD